MFRPMKNGRGSLSVTVLAAAETVIGRPRRAKVATSAALPMSVGRYEVRGLLGEGAMGRVYRAFDPLAGREVAVKTLKEPFASDERVRARFRREAELVS